MRRMNLRSRSTILASISAGCLVAASASVAFVETDDTTGVAIKAVTLHPSTYKPSNKLYSADGLTRQYDRHSNALRYLSGADIFGVKVSGSSAQAFEAAAQNAIAQNKAVFGVDVSDVQLNAKATLVSGDDAAVSFHVMRNGLRIQDAGISFHFKKGSLILVKNETYAEAVVVPSVATDSEGIAKASVGSISAAPRGSKYRVRPTNAGFTLVKVDEYLVAGENQPYLAQVDTSNNTIFELKTKNLHLRGSAVAKVYPRYFGETPSNVGLGFATVQNASARSNDRGEFSTANDTAVPKLSGFKGQYVSVTNDDGDNVEAVGQKVNGQWLVKFEPSVNMQVPWDNPDMAQAMVYVNVNKIVNVAKQYINPTWFNSPLGAHVNNTDHCNAYWDGDTINFFSAGDYMGKTCANTGIISDVAFHEWGHGLDDNTGGIDDNAMSEGFGDALSMYMTGDPLIGVEFMPVDHKPVRDLSVVRVFPKDIVHEPHKDGLIIAGAWYDLYKALQAKLGLDKSKELMGKFLFKGIYQYAKMSDVYQATLALDDDNGNLNDKTPNFCVINKAFTTHGLATADTTCQ